MEFEKDGRKWVVDEKSDLGEMFREYAKIKREKEVNEDGREIQNVLLCGMGGAGACDVGDTVLVLSESVEEDGFND